MKIFVLIYFTIFISSFDECLSQSCVNCNVGPPSQAGHQGNPAAGGPIINHFPHGTQVIGGNRPGRPIVNYFGTEPQPGPNQGQPSIVNTFGGRPQGGGSQGGSQGRPTYNYFPGNPPNHIPHRELNRRPEFGPNCMCYGQSCYNCNVGK